MFRSFSTPRRPGETSAEVVNRVASLRQSDFCPIERHFQMYMVSNLCYPDSPCFVRVILCLCSRRAFSAVSMNFSSSLEESI